METEKIYRLFSVAVTLAAITAAGAFVFFYWNQLSVLITARYFGQDGFKTYIPAVTDAGLLIIETAVFLFITNPLVLWYLERHGKKNQAKLILNLYNYLVWLVISVVLISIFFRDFGAIITSLGLIGFGVTFALQKPILNFVGWLTIITTNPFNVGERIEVQGMRGDVISVHTMYTRVQGTRPNAQTKSEQIISIPNEVILTNPVMNYSRTGGLFSDELVLSITYESNWRRAAQILEKVTAETITKFIKTQVPVTFAEKRAWQEAAKLLDEASKKIKRGFLRRTMNEQIELMKNAETQIAPPAPKPRIQLVLGASSIDLNVLYQTDLYSVRDTKAAITKALLEELEKTDDIEIAYPHLEIMRNEKTGRKHSKVRQLKDFIEPRGQ